MQYIPPSCLKIYQNWGRRELVELNFRGMNYNVQVLRNKSGARFGIGWDFFVSDNKFAFGDHLQLSLVDQSRFKVNLIP